MRASFACEHCGASVRCDQNGCPTVYHDCPKSKAAAQARWEAGSPLRSRRWSPGSNGVKGQPAGADCGACGVACEPIFGKGYRCPKCGAEAPGCGDSCGFKSCELLKGHEGYHESQSGTSWPQKGAPAALHDPLDDDLDEVQRRLNDETARRRAGLPAWSGQSVSPKAASVPPPAPLSVADREAIARSAGVLRVLAGAWRRQADAAPAVEQSPLLRQALRAERLAVDSDELLASLGAAPRWSPDGPGDFPAVDRCPVCSARYPYPAQPEQTPEQRRQAGGQSLPSDLGRQPEAGSSNP